MTAEQLEQALGGFRRRRPFVPFLIEFASGGHLTVPHPEAFDSKNGLYFVRRPDKGYDVFTAESVTRLLDVGAK